MHRRGSLLLSLLMVLGIAFSGLVIRAPAATGTAPAQFTAGDSPVLLAPPTKQKRDRTARKESRERGKKASADERDERDQGDQRARRQDAGRQNAESRLRGRTGSSRARCSGPALIRLREVDGCTHGPDPAPPGFNVNRRVPALPAREANRQTAAIACEGDGESGNRTHVLYVRANNVTSRYSTYLASFRAWAAEADLIFQDSAAKTGGDRQIRFVHNGGCEPIVDEVVLTPAQVADFDEMAGALDSQGYNRPDRFYLSFVDTTSAGICGIGYLWGDDRPSQAENFNNFGPTYSRVDAGCWGGYVASHELMHNLGGVQLSAPNTSGGYHCIDEYDVMCYSDFPDFPDMRYDCPSPAVDDEFDCGNGDYYHTNPPAGSYLSNFWNPANNQFLIGANTSSDDTDPPTVSVSAPRRPKAGKRISVAAKATDNVGVASVAFGVCSGANCGWASARSLGTDSSAPYRASWKAPKKGTFTFLARATDTSGNATVSAKKTVKVKEEKKRKKKR